MTLGLLHCHTEFSARDSLIRVHELPGVAKRLGWGACAITDHGAIEGIPGFLEACAKEGVMPIAGCEVYLSTTDSDKHFHLTVLAKNAQGFDSICSVLSAAADLSDPKRRTVACPLETAFDLLHDVVILSGCFSSPFWRPQGDVDLKAWVAKFGADFFFEVQPLDDWDEQVKLNSLVVLASREYHRPVVVTPDCHFGSATEGQLHEALLAFGNRAVLGSGDDKWKFSTKLNYPMTPQEIEHRLQRAGMSPDDARAAVHNTALVVDRVSPWTFDELPKPAIPMVEGDFEGIVRAAFATREFAQDFKYRERLDEEMRVFKGANLGPYFLLVNECLNLFRERGAMIGPRGSIAGSLVAYLLRISNVDPVEHGLPYWRFWYEGRGAGSMPDADIDLEVRFRPLVYDILRERFGRDKVAQISTYGAFGVRLAVRSAAKTFGVFIPDRNEWEEDLVVPPGATEEQKIKLLGTVGLYRLMPPVAQEFAKKLVGRVEKYGLHPGGFVIAQDSLQHGRGALVRRGKERALCWDMEAAEKLGYLKIDFLGNASIDALKALTSVQRVEDAEKIPLDDQEVYGDFRKGRTAGIPQFETPGMRTFTEMVQPMDFKDLVWCNAAFRKGAFGEGRGPKEMAAAFRENPDSVMVFQEDLMRCCRELAGLSWAETDKIRKICSKSKGNVELAKWRQKFIDGCDTVGLYSREDAEQLWAVFEGAGEYLFNMAHATSYAANAYRIAWLKRQNPARAYTALLNLEKDANLEALLDEADQYGVEVLPPHPNKSTFAWMTDGQRILTPLQHAEGADVRIAKAIMLRRTPREVKRGKKLVRVGGLFQSQVDFTARMGDIKRPGWFDHRLWNPAPHRTAAPSKPSGPEAQGFRAAVRDCSQCELRSTCKAPVPPDFGQTNVLILGDSPGRREDQRGRPFVGQSGDLLFTVLSNHGIDREEVSVLNSFQCKPPEADTKPPNCPWAMKYIEVFKPPLVLAVGKRAWQLVSGLGDASPGITKVNGTLVHRNATAPFGVVPCIHPAAVLRDEHLFPELERAVRKFSRLFFSSQKNNSASKVGSSVE